ncbi:MAG: BREX-2 system phosphatase PglZ [Planctomycetes bacterium]|nr:BREX-2 system phosphatase PglZ [Planctomycetota bacterium]
MNAIPSTHALRAQLEAIERKEGNARRVAMRSYGPVRTNAIETASGPWQIEFCPSALAFRERLAALDAEAAPRTVLLTPCDAQDLGDDVLAFLVRQRLFDPKPREMVKERFELRQIDPRLELPDWFAERLLEASAPESANLAVGYLDEASAWGIVLRSMLGLETARPDLRILLAWARSERARAAWRALDEAQRDRIAAWIAESAGALASVLLAKLAADASFDPLAWGLACEVMLGGTERELGVLQGKLDGGPLDGEVLRLYSEAARGEFLFLRGSSPEEATRVAREGERVIESLGFAARLAQSSVLPGSWKARWSAFGAALHEVLQRGADALPALAAQRGEIESHAFAKEESEAARLARATMALRLARAIFLPAANDASAGLAELSQRYLHEGLWVDRAREALIPGDSDEVLARAYRSLSERATERRELENQRFAAALAAATANGGDDPGLLPIEELLRLAVAPLARELPVLVLVLDGLSWPIAVELMQNVLKSWSALGHAELRIPRPVIAALPTITEVSRASLLCGELVCGGQDTEKKGFANHRELRKLSSAKKEPLLFHQDALGHRAGELALELRAALSDDERRVVGVILNAVDDSLEKGDQLELRWNVALIPLLEQLLELAELQGRAVILTSDHGHVRELLSAQAKPAGAASGDERAGSRYRPATSAARDGELRLRGPRVSKDHGGDIVAPWSERLRYGKVKRGYHGGATPQEVLVPLCILRSLGHELPSGWEVDEQLFSEPAWWIEDCVADAAGGVFASTRATAGAKRPTRRTKKDAAAEKQPSLFPVEEPEPALAATPNPLPSAAADTTPAPAWLIALARTALWKEQVRRAHAAERDAELALRILRILSEHRGRMLRAALALRLAVPPFRLRGMLSMAQRLVNLEGYPILEVREEETVVLEEGVLRGQFGVGE